MISIDRRGGKVKQKKEAGLYAPNAGGGQRARIVAVHNKELTEKIGRLNNEAGKELLKEWCIPDTDIARCFVILGYCDGVYPPIKERKENRFWVVL